MKALPFDRTELARRAKCSPGTLSDWINNKRSIGEHLHDAILREIAAGQRNSGNESRFSDSVLPGVADRQAKVESLNLEQCRLRIKELEARNEVLEAMVLAAGKIGSYRNPPKRKLNSAPTSAEEELLDELERGDAGGASRP